MNKMYRVLVLIVFIGTSCSAQMKNYIYYDLPEAVTDRIGKHIESRLAKNKDLRFTANLYQNSDNNYVVSIIDYHAKSNSDSFNLVIEGIIEKSNRMLRVDNIEIPIMTSEDMIFADLGKTKMPDGRIAKKRVQMIFDGFTITFDRSGKIYEQ
jgi:hypothetical protein